MRKGEGYEESSRRERESETENLFAVAVRESENRFLVKRYELSGFLRVES